VSVDVVDVVSAPGTLAFNRQFGRGMVEAWVLFVSFAGVRTGKVDIPRHLLCESLGLELAYVERCLLAWQQWKWIQPDYEIGRTRITATLANLSGKVPCGIRESLTASEETELGDAGMYEIDKSGQTVLIETSAVDASDPVDSSGDLLAPVESAKVEKLQSMTQKEAKAIKTPVKELPTDVQEVVTKWLEVAESWGIKKRKPVINGDIERKIRRALASYGKDRVFAAIEGCFMRDYNRQNGFVGLDLILRDNSYIEKYELIKDNASTMDSNGITKVPVKPVTPESYVQPRTEEHFACFMKLQEGKEQKEVDRMVKLYKQGRFDMLRFKR